MGKNNNKRELGQFYTPKLFADYAHKMMVKQFGEDWKEKYVVWDNCCGTKNLTRDYNFNELYCSTLENAELEISERYNKEATSFQFDFLNDSLDKLPQGLKDVFAYNKPIIFLINPPYANNTGDNGTGTKEKVCYTMVREKMKEKKMDACIANLYSQFLYRIIMIKEQYNLTNVHIGLFSPTLFLSGDSFKIFRKYFLNEFAFDNAVQFRASHFADVADNWGISFSIWSNGETTDKNNFNYNLIDSIDGQIEVVGNKDVYNIDGGVSASKWVRELTKGMKTYDSINLTSAIKIKEKEGSRKGMLVEKALGYFYCNSNNINKNAQSVGMFSSAFSAGIGVSVTKENFKRCSSFFSARRLILGDWVNWADEYLAPNTENLKYKEFENDSIVYSLFESKSNQSSLRGVEYKGKNWDIKNEFFFMGKNDILALCNEDGFDSTYNDCSKSSERYVYGLLQGIELSSEAQAVLDMAKELTIKSFKYRKMFNEEHPEYQVMNWDCGWYQIKAVVKEYMPNEYKEFDKLYKALAEKMKPMVYELGFLK